MSKTNLEILRDFGAIAEELKNRKVSHEYWEKEEKLLAELAEKHEEERKAIEMSYEKFIQPFTI